MEKIKTVEGIYANIFKVQKGVYILDDKSGIIRKVSSIKKKAPSLYFPNQGYIKAQNPDEFDKIYNHKKFTDGRTAFDIWSSIIFKLGKAPYKNVGISSEWRCFNNFIPFYDKYYEIGYVIDKDILSNPEHKIYSEKTCAFVPKRLNSGIWEFSKKHNKAIRRDPDGYYTVFAGNSNHLIKTKDIEEYWKLYSMYRCVSMRNYIDSISYKIRKEAYIRLLEFYNYNNYVKRPHSITL